MLRMLFAVILAVLFPMGYYGLCWAGFTIVGGRGAALELWRNKKVKLVCGAILACSALWVFLLVAQERTVYPWDYGYAWRSSIAFKDLLFSDPKTAMSQMYNTINHADYNTLLYAVIVLAMKVLGASRTRYVFISCVMFLLPAFLGQAACAVKLWKLASGDERRTSSNRVFLIAVILAAAFPAVYFPLLRGYIDVGLLLPMSAAVYLMLDYDFLAPFGSRSVLRDMIFALLLILAWLSRRYVAYFVLGIASAMIYLALVQVLRPGQTPRKKRFLYAVGHLCIIGGVSLFILLVFFRPFVMRSLMNDYGTMYAAFNAELWTKIRAAGSSFGILAALSAIGCLVYVFWRKRCRGPVTALVLMTLIAAFAFFSVQSMGVHHRLLISVPLFLLEALSILLLCGGVKLKRGGVLCILCGLMYLLNVAYTFVQPIRPALSPASSLLTLPWTPPRRGDLDELHALRSYLADEAGADKSIYVLASSHTLNDEILRQMYLPDVQNALPASLWTHHVDLRNGFPPQFLSADIVVTTDPIQAYLRAGTQEIIRFLAQEVMDPDSPVGRHYTQDSRTFMLDGGVEVRVYQRTSPWEEEDLQFIRDYFDGYYPGREDIFSNRIVMPEKDKR